MYVYISQMAEWFLIFTPTVFTMCATAEPSCMLYLSCCSTRCQVGSLGNQLQMISFDYIIRACVYDERTNIPNSTTTTAAAKEQPSNFWLSCNPQESCWNEGGWVMESPSSTCRGNEGNISQNGMAEFCTICFYIKIYVV